MGQPLAPHSGYRQRQAKLFNHVKTQGEKVKKDQKDRMQDTEYRIQKR
jgi:hypothetical protein